MRYLVLFLSTFTSLSLFSQRTTSFIFLDGCTNQHVEIEFELTYFYNANDLNEPQDSIRIIKSGEPVTLENNLYFISANLDENDWISTFFFDIYPERTSEYDTLYLNKLRSNWNGVNHGSIVKYFHCDQQADGEIVELDVNGTTRATGTFNNGIPISNIKFFDRNGKLIKKEIYRNGNLVRTKNYQN